VSTISVVIPAYNEAMTIGRCLDGLMDGARSGELQIVVVCNGCTDDTARIARSYPVRVIETNIGSKPHALNLGDRAAGSTFPRVYADADVRVPVATVRTLAARLREGDILLASPAPLVETTECSTIVRWYVKIASLLPASKDIGGSGIYALSEKGRKRFDQFPDVISDDGFVRIQFKREERLVLGCTSQVFPPKTVYDLLRTRIRIHTGHIELSKTYPHLWRDNGQSGNKGSIFSLSKDVLVWPQLFVYCAVTVAARLACNVWRKRLWMRDETSRERPQRAQLDDRLPSVKGDHYG
jgi:glycosyltransferase involved in cell wall biosynthesis